MLKRYDVIVKNGNRGRTYHHKNMLYCLGLRYSGTQSKWIGSFDEDDEIVSIETYCKKYGLRCEVNDNQYKRNNKYRTDYFTNHKPFWHDYYFCIYCGRLLRQEHVTVDHIIPIARVKKDKHLQKYIKNKGWEEL